MLHKTMNSVDSILKWNLPISMQCYLVVKVQNKTSLKRYELLYLWAKRSQAFIYKHYGSQLHGT